MVKLWLQVYYKLFALSYARLALIRAFLVALQAPQDARAESGPKPGTSKQDRSRAARLARVERMLPGLSQSVDMGLVTILCWCACTVSPAAVCGLLRLRLRLLPCLRLV